MSLQNQQTEESTLSVTSLTGGCHCGAVSYELPTPPAPGSEDATAYAKNVIPPSDQSLPSRRENRKGQNKWRASHCHCSACRKTVGSLVVSWVNVPSKVVSITKKGPTGKYMVSDHATREFCQTCGTSLFFDDEKDPGCIDITVASIATPYLFDFIEFDGHFWLEDVSTMVLGKDNNFGGLAGLMNDGLPRTMGSWGSASVPSGKV